VKSMVIFRPSWESQSSLPQTGRRRCGRPGFDCARGSM